VPLPDSTPPALTVTSEVIEPVTLSVPASTVVGPVYVLAPLRIRASF